MRRNAGPTAGSTVPWKRSHAMRPPWLSVIFLVSLTLPFTFFLGGIRLSPYRLILIVSILPLLFYFIQKSLIKIRIPDILLLAFCAWCNLSFVVVHGLGGGMEPAGIFSIETIGAYLLGRVLVRSPRQFFLVCNTIFLLCMLMMPFAIYETITGENTLLRMANALGSNFDDVWKEDRWGLDRVQGPFEHMIHFGVFTGSVVSLVYYVVAYRRGLVERVTKSVAVAGTAALALSSGPLTALVAQTLLIAWDVVLRTFKARWTVLALGVAALWLLAEIVANRSAAEIFISYFAFSPWTAYNRLRIWEFGSASVLHNPLFGIGLNDWLRPYWMSASIDMFWLVPAVRHGLVAGLLLQVTVLWIFLKLALLPIADPRVAAYRKGFLICLVGFYLAGWTVHYWNAMYVYFMFILGSGVWMFDTEQGVGRPRWPRRHPRNLLVTPSNGRDAEPVKHAAVNGDGPEPEAPFVAQQALHTGVEWIKEPPQTVRTRRRRKS